MSKTKSVDLSGLELFMLQDPSPFNIALAQCGIRKYFPKYMHIERVDENHIRYETQFYVVEFEVEKTEKPIWPTSEENPYQWLIKSARVSDLCNSDSQLPKTIHFVNYEKTKFNLLGVIRSSGYRDFLIYHLLCKLEFVTECEASGLLNELWEIPTIRASKDENLNMCWILPENSTNISTIYLRYDGESFKWARIQQNRQDFIFEKKKGEWIQLDN